MNLKKLRGPLLAALATMLLSGSVALATNPPGVSPSAGANAVEPGSAGPDTDNVQFEDTSGAPDAAEAGSAEAKAAGPDTDNVQDQSGTQDGPQDGPQD
ncbi:MAG: hypothetical protein ABI978_03395 [Chloroflexota bacterium]